MEKKSTFIQNPLTMLRHFAQEASLKAYSPYSNFKVGSAIETNEGVIFSGSNVENSSYGNTICAERVAIFKAVSEGHLKFKRIYIYTEKGWPPCGACRQVMSEFADENFEIILGQENHHEETFLFKDLFPNAFKPNHLTMDK
jgi:cytidine deaminase